MTFISFAQNFEDVMLWRALGHIQHGFYIDIGAAWPSEDSVTKAFYERGWHGINVEPNPQLYQLLVDERLRDINLPIAVGEEPGILTMNFIPDTGLSSLQADIVQRHGLQTIAGQVQVLTLADLCRKYVFPDQPIHFLKVDVEGFEHHVLAGANWTDYRPWIVIIEATLPMSQVESYADWEPLLLAAEYRFVYADGINRFYVAKEHVALGDAFRYPPNVFDGFIQVNQERAAQARTQRAEEAERFALEERAVALAKEAHALMLAEQANHKNTELNNKNTELNNKNTELLGVITAIYASRSWRVTAPMRWIVRQMHLLRYEGFRSRVFAFFRKVKKVWRRYQNQRIDRISVNAIPNERVVSERATRIYQRLRFLSSKLPMDGHADRH